MHGILFGYEMKPTTWVYLSSLLIIGIYFKFRRFWSMRNLDLLGLIALSPGLILVSLDETRRFGYVWLFVVGGFFLVRLLLDPVLVRRPLLEPNLSADGLTFTGGALLIFLMGNILSQPPSDVDLTGARGFEQIVGRDGGEKDAPGGARGGRTTADARQPGPGFPLFYALAYPSSAWRPSGNGGQTPDAAERERLASAARTTAIVAHLALVLGLVLIGYRHFGSLQTGVAGATLYLLLPYTAQMTAHVDHVLPAALTVWAVAAYRRPLAAGILLGLAAGAVYYPLFLLPLWCGFYWQRGLVRFAAGVGLVFVVLITWLACSAASLAAFGQQLVRMFMLDSTLFHITAANGFWHYHEPVYRIPVIAAFVALAASFALWPAQKNLGTLLSCSACLMLGVQFWRADQGGLYMAWYLPLLVLVIFRPNLEDRMAVTAVSEQWALWQKIRRTSTAASSSVPASGAA